MENPDKGSVSPGAPFRVASPRAPGRLILPRNRFAVLMLGAAACFVFSSGARASTIEELVLSDGIDSVSITVSDTNVVTVTCNAGACGQITQANVGTKIVSDGAHGEIGITRASFGAGNNYTISLTAVGGGDSFLPTLMNLDQMVSESNSAGGTLTDTFTDTDYTDLDQTLNVSDSNVNDIGIQASTVDDSVFTSSQDAILSGTEIYTNSLTGHSDDSGPDGASATNPDSAAGSLTAQVILAFSGSGAIQANISISDVDSVPEPASIVLLGVALCSFSGLALLRRLLPNLNPALLLKRPALK